MMGAQKMRTQDYVQALEEERRKIQVFQRELPLCLEIVTRTIESCKQQLSECIHGGQSECSEQTSSEAPAFEEFIPLKRGSSSDADDEQHSHKPSKSNTDQKRKAEWLSSAQLWNQSPDPPPKEDGPKKGLVIEVKRNGGAFQPFHREQTTGRSNQQLGKVPSPVAGAAASTSSTAETASGGNSGNSSKKDEKGQNQRKQRRCWSPELHRRFLQALQQLGGSHAATPKQIRELMKVDGLTNDEVKSHLQKYRLHTRKPSPTNQNNSNPQPPQIVVVGGIWMPPPEYGQVAAPTASGEASNISAANGIYAPVATPATGLQKGPKPVTQNGQKNRSECLHSERRSSNSEGLAHSNSSATSSSTHTITTSPPSLRCV